MNTNDLLLNLVEPADQNWQVFLEGQASPSIFYHPAWADMLSACYGFRPFVVMLTDSDGVVHAGLPMMEVKRFLRDRRWVSLPFSDYCAPLADRPEMLQCLLEEISALQKNSGAPNLEIRWEISPCPNEQSPAPYVLHSLRLDNGLNAIASRIHHTHLRNIRIAEQRGLQIRRGVDAHSMHTFYRLHLHTRRKQGVPVQPERYFKLLDELILQRGLGFILLAYHGETCLAGAVFLHWKKTLTYKYGASIEAGLSMRPNHLIFWDAIQWGCENGYSLLDFGRSDADNTGLRTFKSRWGADETPLQYTRFPASDSKRSPDNGLPMRLVQSVIRNAPVCICKLGGQIYYKYLA